MVDEVGSDAVRFMMLFRKNDAVLDFDLAKVIEQSKDNPVFYVQYGHARGHSVFRNAREVIPDLPEEAGARAAFLGDAAVERLTDPAELGLLRRLALYPADDRGGGGRHMSRTESLFICMISPANFMRCGRGGAICPIYASLSIMMQRSRRRGWRWSRASSRFWHRAWPFSASMLRTRCDRVGANAAHMGICEGIWQRLVRL